MIVCRSFHRSNPEQIRFQNMVDTWDDSERRRCIENLTSYVGYLDLQWN